MVPRWYVDGTDALAAHWGPAFSDIRGISLVAAQRVLLLAPQHAGSVLRLEHDESDEFCEIAKHINRSSHGPDGVPYHAWLTGRGAPLRVLYVEYIALVVGTEPPPFFNEALLVFIPKGGTTHRGPQGTKPWHRSFVH